VREVYASSYLELRSKYPKAYAIRRSNGGWVGIIDEVKK